MKKFVFFDILHLSFKIVHVIYGDILLKFA